MQNQEVNFRDVIASYLTIHQFCSHKRSQGSLKKDIFGSRRTRNGGFLTDILAGRKRVLKGNAVNRIEIPPKSFKQN